MCDYCKRIDKSKLKDNEIIVWGIYSDYFRAPDETEFLYCPMCGRRLKESETNEM